MKTSGLATERALILDCQTTGATPANGALLEIAWSISTGRNAGNLESYLVQQDDPIPRRITNLTGISDADLETAIDKKVIAQLIAAKFEDGIRTCVIHYAQFEKPFLADLFAELERDFPFQIICTHQVAKRLFPNLPSRGVRALAGYFGHHVDDLKRARCHVQATQVIWQELCEQLGKNNVTDFDDLKDWMAQPFQTKRTGFQYPLDPSKRLSMPNQPGIYRMLNKKGHVLYVGKAISLKNRVNSYFRGKQSKGSRKQEMLAQVWDIDITVCESAVEAALLETDEIKRLNPPYNVSLKRGDRKLTFMSRDFASFSEVQDEQHPIGPFPSTMTIECLLLLKATIQTDQFNPAIFFDTVDDALLEPGFKLFYDRHWLEAERRASITTRQLLALGSILYRRAVKAGLEELESEAEEETLDQGVEEEHTPEDIADKLERVLMRAAQSYLRSKQLTRLLNANVVVKDRVEEPVLMFRAGKIVQDSEHRLPERFEWRNLQIDDYDRMSVLMQEIIRQRAFVIEAPFANL